MLAEQARSSVWLRRSANAVAGGAIALSVGAAMVETLPGQPWGAHVATARAVAAIVFLIEFAVRLWLVPTVGDATGRTRLRTRLRYLLSPLGVIDAVAFLPWLVSLAVPLGTGLLELAGMLTLLKLARYFDALGLIAVVIAREGRPLIAALTAMAILLLILSTAMYLLEREAQPEIFRSIPDAMWWGIVTMATVGYGDLAPVTSLGRVLGGFTMLLGIAMFAVPAGLLATGFAEELRKREFVVTWQSVARVPLFARLDAHRIAAIAALLRPRIVPPNTVIVRRNDPAEAMFFIMEGEVEVDARPHPVRLKAGQFFGEIGLLHDVPRTATVAAVGECRLLALAVADFRRLIHQYPSLKAEIERVAEARQGGASSTFS
ncbi:MAG: ion transporter, partial [Actinobacteria bacterium]|nr:ion transporter [Actinomycetota bacterium]